MDLVEISCEADPSLQLQKIIQYKLEVRVANWTIYLATVTDGRGIGCAMLSSCIAFKTRATK